MSMQMLEENWNKIKTRVIEPLWQSTFKNPYVFLKMDYDDFESLAGEELTKAFKTYDSEKSNIYTFSKRVLINKANTEIRDKNREKRMCDVVAESIYAKTSEDSETTLEDIVENITGSTENYDELKDVKEMLFKLLKPKEREVVELSLHGFSNNTIAGLLKMNCKDVLGIKKRMAESSAVIRILRMSGFLGGDEE